MNLPDGKAGYEAGEQALNAAIREHDVRAMMP
ncbi:Hypothetical protein NGAL_HAMBI2566_48020 [Neorhizobium galegae bv. orientalis]|nr:Hypothetical protein NGAL_HAMBI2566_48020 [Neorhizobium galegae bv. orientalis]